MNKICRTCGQEQDEGEFPVHYAKTGKRRNDCKSCYRKKANDSYVKKGPPPPRKGWVENGIGYIPLTQDQVALVDPEDIDRLSQHNWSAWWSTHTKSYYAVWTSPRVRDSGTKEVECMHRVVLGVTDPLVKVDHEDHNTLNNRKYNLRPANNNQNARNARRRKDNKSGVKGVIVRGTKYIALIRVNGKRKQLGTRSTLEEAAALYAEAAKKEHKEFAHLG